jgi:hypothetical protein
MRIALSTDETGSHDPVVPAAPGGSGGDPGTHTSSSAPPAAPMSVVPRDAVSTGAPPLLPASGPAPRLTPDVVPRPVPGPTSGSYRPPSASGPPPPDRADPREGRWPRSAPPVRPSGATPKRENGAPTRDGGTPNDEGGSRAVALLLGVAAIVAAILTARAALLSSDASSDWQLAVRQELKRGTLAVEQVNYVYGTEAVQAFGVATANVRADEAAKLAPSAAPDAAARLQFEAQVQQQVSQATVSSSAVASDPKYALPDGGYDMQRRMADERATTPADVALAPDEPMAAGDALADRANRMMSTTIAIGATFLFGALAQAFRRRRLVLLALGWGALTVGALLALALEFVA